MPSVHAFCPSCGGNVECNVVIDGAKRQLRCKNCKFLVEEKKIAAPAVQAMTFAVPDAGPADAPAMPARTPPPVAAAPMRALGTVLSAEDTPAIRMAMQNLLVSKGVAKNVVSVENGFDALIAFHRATRAGAQLDLLIFDVNMPILDGINAAVCVRAAEKAAGTALHPILFFTSNVCDEPFRRALDYLAPARYLNKGAPASGVELGERLVTVLQNLLGGGT